MARTRSVRPPPAPPAWRRARPPWRSAWCARTRRVRRLSPPPAPRPTPAASSRDELPFEHGRALLRREGLARAAEHARDLGGEVPAAREHLAGAAVRDQLSLA